MRNEMSNELSKLIQEVKVMSVEPDVKITVASYKEALEEMEDRLNEDPRNFVATEALKIYRHTDDDAVALEALRLIYDVVHNF